MKKTAPCLALLVAAALPVHAQDAGSDEEPRWTAELESSSHVVRDEDERFSFSSHAGKWRYKGTVASLTPPFQESQEQAGVFLARRFGVSELLGTFRYTSTPGDANVAASVGYVRERGEGKMGGEITFVSADLPALGFVFQENDDPVAGRFFFHRKKGLDFDVFFRSNTTFDLRRPTEELLDRLPRSMIVGAETLADLYIDEGRLENAFGASVGFQLGITHATVYLKSGDQTLPGLPDGEDFLGFGAEVDVEGASFAVHSEIDMRQIDSLDGITSFNRGRALLDYRQETERYEWGGGLYVQGETESYSEIPDFYDTAGIAAKFGVKLRSGKRMGGWLMAEDNAPAFQKITRLAFYLRADEREWGVGVRRDEIGRQRFAQEEIGGFVFGRLPVGGYELRGDLGFISSDAYGRIVLVVRP